MIHEAPCQPNALAAGLIKAVNAACGNPIYFDHEKSRAVKPHVETLVFDFFRKNKPDEPAQTQQRKPVTRQGPATVASPPTVVPPTFQETMLGHETPSTKGLVVEERSHIGSAVEEAAIFFASGSDDQALATLKAYLAEHPKETNAQPWLMLLELYQQQREKALFEELALEFVMRFERSAPSWVEPDVVDERKTERTASDYYALKGALGEANSVDLDRMTTVANAGTGLRLDLSRVEGIESAFAAELARKLKELRKAGTAIRLISPDKLKRLVADAAATTDRGRWELLFEILQITGAQTEFEDQAIEYAIAFEESPPSWEEPPARVDAGAEDDDIPEEIEDAYYFKGALESGAEPQLKELAKYAASRADVLIDMADVPRIDFTFVGQFIEALIQLTAQGKTLTIRSANEMVQALLAVMGINQFATLQKKKAR